MRNVPKLRFKGFSDEWRKNNILNMLNSKKGSIKIGPFGSALKKEFYVEDGIKVYAQENIFNNDFTLGNYYITNEKYESLKSCELEPMDLVISMMGTIGSCAVFPSNAEKGIMNSHLLRLQFKDDYNVFLIAQLLKESEIIRKQISRLSVGSIMSGLSSTVVQQLEFNLPSIEEQNKIENFLTKVDNLIEKQEEKVKNLEQYKKGMMQKIFSQEIRFKKDDGGEYPKWEENKLNKILIERKEKNSGNLRVCSVAVRKGVIDQIEHLGRSFAAKDTSNYKLVKYGDIIYTKSPTGDFPYGIVKQSFLKEDVVVSPLYGVFEPINFSIGFMLHVYFNYRENTNTYLHSIIQKGAKNTINISNDTFLSKAIKLPASIEEQEKIANLLSKIDLMIDKEKENLEELRQWKKGLLQQMFV